MTHILTHYLPVFNVSVGANAGSTLPDSTLVGVFASIVAAVAVYSVRQYWERKKLRRALLTEIKQMEGLKDCADQMDRISAPPRREIQPDDVPAASSIPTTVYESSAGKIGLLGGLCSGSELERVVQFYSQVLRYKGIIKEINREGEVSNTDQEDLHDSIGDLAESREDIIDNSQFDV